MADGLVRMTEDRGQRTEVLSRRSRAFNKRSAQRHTNICLLSSVFCLLMSVPCSLNAEELPDPTRPPAMIFAPDTAPGQGAVENRWSSGLQTIIISASRRAAIIDGQTVELGAKHGNARLIEVNEGSVILQRARSRQVLTLFPNVKISRKGSPENESQVNQPSSASKVQSGKHQTMPAALEEKK